MKARDNPFSVDRLDGLRYRFLDGSWDGLLQRLRQLNYRASIVGGHGCGKSTLLEELGRRLEAAGHRVHQLRLNEHQPRLPRNWIARLWQDLDAGDLILFDGWEQLHRYAVWNLLRRSRAAGGLIVTTHTSGALPTLVECRTSRALLFDLLEDLLGNRAFAVREEAERLHAQHNGNLREVWRALYDQCAHDILKIG